MSVLDPLDDYNNERHDEPNRDNPYPTDAPQGQQPTPIPSAAPATPQPSAAPSFDLSQAREIAGRYGATIADNELSDVLAVQQGRQTLEEFESRQRARGGSTSQRQHDSQSAEGNALYGSGTGNGLNTPGGAFTPQAARQTQSAPAFKNTNPLFDDPASRLMEDYALDQFRRRQNPDPNSGAAMFEQYARQLIETLKGPVYSPSDEAIIKTQATNQIMIDRDQTRQRWLEELSRRGIPPSSGPALEGLQRIEQHFQGLKTQVDAQFARDAIQRTRDQRMQVLDTAGQLANSEEGRLREALTYASIPKQLADNSFQQGLQLVGAGGSPQSMLASALNLYNTVTTNNRLNAQDRANAIESVFETIAGLRF